MVLSETNVNENEKINVECDDEKNVNTASNNIGSDNSLKDERYIHIYFNIITKHNSMHKKRDKNSNIGYLIFYSSIFF